MFATCPSSIFQTVRLILQILRADIFWLPRVEAFGGGGEWPRNISLLKKNVIVTEEKQMGLYNKKINFLNMILGETFEICFLYTIDGGYHPWLGVVIGDEGLGYILGWLNIFLTIFWNLWEKSEKGSWKEVIPKDTSVRSRGKPLLHVRGWPTCIIEKHLHQWHLTAVLWNQTDGHYYPILMLLNTAHHRFQPTLYSVTDLHTDCKLNAIHRSHL